MAEILVVDDTPSNRSLLRALLEHDGHRVVEASSGGEAIQRTKLAAPDCVITDIFMPRASGWDLIRELKSEPATCDIPIICCSAAYGRTELERRAESAGAAGAVPLPADPQDLWDLLHDVLDTSARVVRLDEPAAGHTPCAASPRVTVMIVDDDEHIRSALTLVVSETDWMELVGSAATVDEAIELARTVLPDVAVLDVRMPDGGAERALAEFRRLSPRTLSLAYSAVLDMDTVGQVLRAGAVGYLDKGMSASQLVEAVRMVSQGKSGLGVIGSAVAGQLASAVAREGVQESQFRSLLQSTTEGIYGLDAAGRCTFINTSGARMLGYAPDEIVGRAIHDLAHHTRADGTPYPPDDCPGLQTIATGSPADVDDEVLWRRDGTSFAARYTVAPILTEGDVTGAVVTFTDITERRRAEEALRESRERYRMLVEGTEDIVYAVRAAGRWSGFPLFVSPQVERILGWSPEDFLENPHLWARMIHPDDLPLLKRQTEQLFEEGGQVTRCFRVRHGLTGEYRWMEDRVVVTPWDGGELVLLGVARDVTDRRKLEEQLSHQALYDGLTGLANRALFVSRAEQALARADRAGSRVGVLLLDLDNFKGVNDALGHGSGDSLLVEVARRLESTVRPADTVARLGGDEFGFVIEDLRTEADAASVAERVLDALRPPVVVAGREIFPAGSLGGRVSEPGERHPTQLLSDADTAMYAAKAGRKGTFVLFHPDMQREASARFSIETELRAALEREELKVHYQPIVDLTDGRATGVEALVRWNHPERGPIPPAEFIPVAEQTGLIVPLGRWVLRTALEQLRAWRAEGRARGVRMSVNVTARELKEEGFCRDLRRLLRRTGLTPASLNLEITESATSADPSTVSVLSELKALGVKLAIDDFGTGYSSLGYLGRLPVHTIKIDKRFVGQVPGEAAEATVCRAICSLATDLGLDLVAEGVETEEQARQLLEHGCRFAQGYHFARPMPAAAAGEFLDACARSARRSRGTPAGRTAKGGVPTRSRAVDGDSPRRERKTG